MPRISEPDRARSIVVAARDAEAVRAFVQSNFIVSPDASYYHFPQDPQTDFELVRGVGPMIAWYVVHELGRKGVEARAMVWDEVGDDVSRAPTRMPGIVGEHYHFVVEDGRVCKFTRTLGNPRPSTGWRKQAGQNHEHPSNGRPERIEAEIGHVQGLCSDLAALFPDRFFVVEHRPCDTITFYEPDGDAPTESDTEWQNVYSQEDPTPVRAAGEAIAEAFRALGSNVTVTDTTLPTCYECGGTKVADAEQSPICPGVVLATCQGCGKRYIAASRVIRTTVGRRPEA